ncbi:MAG: bacteriophage Gp15 family protein [Oscillospiraceae bacterium]|jgi:hypothetical protein|nr:bacteriophage Gp15 family protein [Oscillospiraceae bacterium]
MKLGFSLKKYVALRGKKYYLDVGFRNVMRAAALLKDSGISERMRVSAGLKLLLTHTSHTRSLFLPCAAKFALLDGIFTLLESAGNNNAPSPSARKNLLSLEDDGALIYGAFMQTYGIDLQKDDIDWREFYALLSCIPENTALFCVMKARLSMTSEDLNDGLETLFNQLIGR